METRSSDNAQHEINLGVLNRRSLIWSAKTPFCYAMTNSRLEPAFLIANR